MAQPIRVWKESMPPASKGLDMQTPPPGQAESPAKAGRKILKNRKTENEIVIIIFFIYNINSCLIITFF